jgi:hypothetical protein
MNPKILLCLALVAFNLAAHARLVRWWSDAELSAASDLVVVGHAIKVKDLNETNSLGWPSTATFQSRFRGVETTFKISAVRKGTPARGQIVLHHYREEIGWGEPPNGPTFISFTPGAPYEYLLYLKQDGTNRYAPAAGQVDPGISIKPAHFGDTAPLREVMARLSAKVPQLSMANLSERGPYGQNSVTADYSDTNGHKLMIIAKAYDSETAAKAGQELDQRQIQAGGWNKKEIIEGVQVFEFTDYGTMYFQIGRDTFNLTMMGNKKGAVASLLRKVSSALIADLAPPPKPETDQVPK